MTRWIKITLITLLLFLVSISASAQMQTTAGGFTLRFISVEYDWDAPSSEWTYGLTWDGTAPELSHLTFDICDTAEVLSYSPTDLPVLTSDGSVTAATNKVIKWDDVPDGYLTPGEEKVFSFVLDDVYAVESVTFWPKAGSANNVGTIFGPSCVIAAPEIEVIKGCTPDVFVGDVIQYTITVTNTGNVPLTNVQVADPRAGINASYPTLAVGESQVINASITAASTGPLVNTASASGAYYGNSRGDEASCTTEVWALTVGKTADTSYTRDWDWTVQKSVVEDEVDICSQSSSTLNYTVSVARSANDSDHLISGTIGVHNPAPIAAPIAGVSDSFAGFTATIDCGVSFPFSLPAGGSLSCSYQIQTAGAVAGTNTGTASLANGTLFSATATVEFGNPTTEIDASATVSDVISCPAGFTCSPSPFPQQVYADATIPYQVTVTNTDADCNSYFNVGNTATLSESEGPHTASAETGIYTCQCSYGCTLTIGYWKTHAGFTGRNADDVTPLLPIWLGDQSGALSIEVDSAGEAVEYLSMAGGASNGIVKLYAQLLAAKLNIANGAYAADIAVDLANADEFLSLFDSESWELLDRNRKKQVLTWASMFDAFNNGILGPGHCD